MATPNVTPLDTGAASALSRLETQEAEAYADVLKYQKELQAFEKERHTNAKFFDDALARDRRALIDASLMASTERWGKLLKPLREYENVVSPEKRGEGEKVTQKEAARIVKMIISLLHLGIDGGLVSISQDALRIKKPEDIYAHGQKLFRRTITDLLETAVREDKLPSWVVPEETKSL